MCQAIVNVNAVDFRFEASKLAAHQNESERKIFSLQSCIATVNVIRCGENIFVENQIQRTHFVLVIEKRADWTKERKKNDLIRAQAPKMFPDSACRQIKSIVNGYVIETFLSIVRFTSVCQADKHDMLLVLSGGKTTKLIAAMSLNRHDVCWISMCVINFSVHAEQNEPNSGHKHIA